MEPILIIFYTLLLSIIILKTNLFQSRFVSKQFTLFVFLLKIIISFLYGYIHWVNGWRDTFSFFGSSKVVAKLWPEHPFMMLRFIFGPVMDPLPQNYQYIFEQSGIAYYGLERSGFIVRVNSFFQLFSGGYYSVHCIFFAFISLIGIFYIYTFFSKYFQSKSLLLKLFIYFTPSIIYWTSGAQKDTLIMFGVGLIMITLSNFLKSKSIFHGIALFLAFLFTYYARNYVALVLLPALVAFLISEYTKLKPIPSFALIYTLSIIAFFTAKYIHPALDFPAEFVEIQNIFISKGGGSAIAMSELQPNFLSFLKAVPKALSNIILHPNFTISNTPYQILAAIENGIFVLLGILCLFAISLKKISAKQQQLILFCLAFSLGYYLLLGFTVSNVGALVRYKSVPMTFLGIAFICLLDLKKLPNPIQNFIQIKNFKFKNYGN